MMSGPSAWITGRPVRTNPRRLRDGRTKKELAMAEGISALSGVPARRLATVLT